MKALAVLSRRSWAGKTTAAAAALAASLALVTAAAGEPRTEIGPGGATCGAWLENHGSQQEAWIFGYLSRAGQQHPGDILAPIDGPAIREWVSNYCHAHPLDRLTQAADALEAELAARNSPKRPAAK